MKEGDDLKPEVAVRILHHALWYLAWFHTANQSRLDAMDILMYLLAQVDRRPRQ